MEPDDSTVAGLACKYTAREGKGLVDGGHSFPLPWCDELPSCKIICWRVEISRCTSHDRIEIRHPCTCQ